MKLNRYWFGPKVIGLGPSPKTWEGWACVASYIVAVTVFTRLYRGHAGDVALIATAAFLAVTAFTYKSSLK